MDSHTAEPTLEEVAEETGWQCYKSLDGLCYARKIVAAGFGRPVVPEDQSAPLLPVIVRGEDPMDLRDQIRGWEGQHTA